MLVRGVCRGHTHTQVNEPLQHDLVLTTGVFVGKTKIHKQTISLAIVVVKHDAICFACSARACRFV